MKTLVMLAVLSGCASSAAGSVTVDGGGDAATDASGCTDGLVVSIQGCVTPADLCGPLNDRGLCWEGVCIDGACCTAEDYRTCERDR